MWGAVSFLFSPGGRVLVIALAFVLWGAYQRVDATSDCEEAQLSAELLESQRQLEIARQIASEARIRADAAEAEQKRLETLANDITNDINVETDGSCDISPDLRQRLLEIR